MRLEFSQQIVDKYSYTKFHKNPSSRNQDFHADGTDGRTDRQVDRRTEMTKLIFAFRNSANAPKND